MALLARLAMIVGATIAPRSPDTRVMANGDFCPLRKQLCRRRIRSGLTGTTLAPIARVRCQHRRRPGISKRCTFRTAPRASRFRSGRCHLFDAARCPLSERLRSRQALPIKPIATELAPTAWEQRKEKHPGLRVPALACAASTVVAWRTRCTHAIADPAGGAQATLLAARIFVPTASWSASRRPHHYHTIGQRTAARKDPDVPPNAGPIRGQARQGRACPHQAVARTALTAALPAR
jgi:hypothetical protein